MLDEHIKFFKGAIIKQEIDPLSRREFPARVLRCYPLCAATQPCLGTTVFQAFQNVFHRAPLTSHIRLGTVT